MGVYPGQRENPCPRCGGVVGTLFISVSPMSFSQKCGACGVSEFTPEEDAGLGGTQAVAWQVEPAWPVPTLTTAEAVNARLGGKP